MREVDLAPIQYRLEDYELPDHLVANGTLDIEICHIDDAPYVWAFELDIYNPATDRTVKHYYCATDKVKNPNDVDIKNFLHRDQKLMDRIFEESATEAMWS